MRTKKTPIFLLQVLMLTQTYFFLPLIPLYAKEAGLPAFLIGQIIFFYTLPQGIAKIFIGNLVDRIGCKSVLTLNNIIFGLGLVFYFFPGSFLLLAAGQFITGMSRAFFMTTTAVYFSEMDVEARGTNLGIRTAAIGLGFFLGPVLGGYASDLWGMKILFFILIFSLSLNFGLLYILPDFRHSKIKKKKETTSIKLSVKMKSLFTNLSFINVVLSGITIAGIITLIDNYLPLYLDNISFPVKLLGIILSIKGISQIFFGPVIGKLSDKFGRYLFVYFGIICGTLGIMLLPLNQNFWMLILLVFLTSMGFTILNPITNALAGETVDPSNRGLAIGLWQSTVSFSMAIFSQLYSFIYANYAIANVFFTTSIILGISLVIILIIRKKQRDVQINEHHNQGV